ncbi:hypothetical protein PVL29_007098 [Vitis rotundifolia]|uniref:WHIM1 domain-containing protein n=1 Tax=Vitis rotundifolia TaxID=103349 RepID=A0AA38ZZK1_VITRO|nr:hypothetical protein PVL29_007098 [Vitis rotundifolia]
MNHHKQRNGMLTIYTEIDEIYPGEVWLLGLMDGEYSDLSIEEKLNALMALVDFVSGGNGIRMARSPPLITLPLLTIFIVVELSATADGLYGPSSPVVQPQPSSSDKPRLIASPLPLAPTHEYEKAKA